MYAVEEEIRDKKLTGEAKQIHRLMYSKPLVEHFFDWVGRELSRQGFTPSNPYIQALNYVRERRSGSKSFSLIPTFPSIPTISSERCVSFRWAENHGYSVGPSSAPSTSASSSRSSSHADCTASTPTPIWSMSCSASPCILQAVSPSSPRDSGNSISQTNPCAQISRPHRLINTSRSYRLRLGLSTPFLGATVIHLADLLIPASQVRDILKAGEHDIAQLRLMREQGRQLRRHARATGATIRWLPGTLLNFIDEKFGGVLPSTTICTERIIMSSPIGQARRHDVIEPTLYQRLRPYSTYYWPSLYTPPVVAMLTNLSIVYSRSHCWRIERCWYGKPRASRGAATIISQLRPIRTAGAGA